MKIDQAMLMNMSDTELQGWLVSWLTKRREKERKLQQNIWKSKLLDDKTFLRMFRMTRPDFLWLVDQLRETLDEYQSSVDWPEPLSAETQVSVSLYYLGHGCSFTKLNTLFGLIPTVGTPTVLDFVEAVRVVFHKVVGMPAHTDLAAWDEISQRFLKKGGIPGVVGVIDAMHVPFFQPRPGFIWRNRRGWSSIIVQTVVDADGNFQDYIAGFHGSTNDQRVFRESPIGDVLIRDEQPVFPPGTFLLADRGYSDMKWIMRPYTKNDSEAALNFTALHAKTWKIADLTFRVLRARFRVLMTRVDLPPVDVQWMVLSCMILHNLRNGRGQHVYPRPDLRFVEKPDPSPYDRLRERAIERAYRAGKLDILKRRDELAEFLLPT